LAGKFKKFAQHFPLQQFLREIEITPQRFFIAKNYVLKAKSWQKIPSKTSALPHTAFFPDSLQISFFNEQIFQLVRGDARIPWHMTYQ